MKVICYFGLPLLFATGCVHSHRAPIVYTPVAEPAIVTVAPASERPVVRVYPETSPVVTEAPAATGPVTSPGDLALANTIRGIFQADPALASEARNVRISIINGIVTMTGTVMTEHDRAGLHSAIAGIPGVTRVDDRVQVNLNR